MVIAQVMSKIHKYMINTQRYMIYVTIKQQIMHLYIVNSTNCANIKELAVFSGSANLMVKLQRDSHARA